MGSVRKFGIGESRYLLVGKLRHRSVNHSRLPETLGNDPVQPLDGRVRQSQGNLSPA